MDGKLGSTWIHGISTCYQPKLIIWSRILSLGMATSPECICVAGVPSWSSWVFLIFHNVTTTSPSNQIFSPLTEIAAQKTCSHCFVVLPCVKWLFQGLGLQDVIWGHPKLFFKSLITTVVEKDHLAAPPWLKNFDVMCRHFMEKKFLWVPPNNKYKIWHHSLVYNMHHFLTLFFDTTRTTLNAVLYYPSP